MHKIVAKMLTYKETSLVTVTDQSSNSNKYIYMYVTKLNKW